MLYSTGTPAPCPVLISRQQPLAQLLALWAKACAGQGQVAFVSGEAGIGKSRLVREITSRLAGNTHSPLFLQGRCFEEDQSIPYAPWLDLVRSFLDRQNQNPGQTSQLFEAAPRSLQKLLPELGKISANKREEGANLSVEQEKRWLWQTLADFIFKLARGQPLLVVIEDLHWADDASLEFLLYLARRLLTQPILFLLTYRREEVGSNLKTLLAQCDRERLAYEEVLTSLDLAETAAFIRATLKEAEPPSPNFVETLHRLTEGNPFFLEEVLKSLVTSGNLNPKKKDWNRHPPEELSIPRTVQVAVQRRTDRLDEAARQILVLAAVNGRRFDFDLLQALSSQDELALLGNIKKLIQAQLVVEETADRYAFRHALTRQAVYADLLGRERRALHRQLAEKLELFQAGTDRNRLGDLVFHYYKGEVWAKVTEYGQRAGDATLALYSPRAALTYYNWTLQAFERLGQPVGPGLYEIRGKAHEMLSDYEEAHQDYTCELEAAYRLADKTAQWQSLINLGALWRGRDYERSRRYLESATELAREIGNSILLGLSLNLMGNWILNSDQPWEARRYHRAALALFEAENDRNGLADTLDFLGVASLIAGNLLEAKTNFAQALAIFKALDRRQRLISILTMSSLRGPNYLTAMLVPGETTVSQALADSEEALRLAQEIEDSAGETLARSIMVASLGMQGCYAAALEQGRTSLRLANQIEHPQWIIFANWAMGVIYLDLLDLALARHYLEQALNQARQLGVLFLVHLMQGFLASVLIAQGDTAQAEKLLESAPGPDSELLAHDSGWLLPLWQLLRAHLQLALAKKDPARALAIIEKGKAELPHLASGSVIPGLWYYHGQALAALGRVEEAETVWQAALVAAEGQETHSLEWRILVGLGKLYLGHRRGVQAEATLSQARQRLEELAKPLGKDGLGERFLKQAEEFFPVAVPLTSRKASKQIFGGLTERERTIAALVAQGQTNRLIAEKLSLSERTVDKHVENIKLKLDFNSRAQIAIWAAEKGLLNSSKI